MKRNGLGFEILRPVAFSLETCPATSRLMSGVTEPTRSICGLRNQNKALLINRNTPRGAPQSQAMPLGGFTPMSE
ncbi:hypothetical protein EYF80_046502 [Liparis tanakae]|uniref:Uncharacterized protein n=1 Tax=Liparis tanakae TaxID=230148 RepID=A0A4Z2FQ04_9TELE|nr:hypothetical protein EYF80_046502 [Liparis tanakae]